MIHGPSAGPAMVLNILMRWPALITVALAGGTGLVVIDQFTLPQATASPARETAKELKIKELLIHVPPQVEQNTMVRATHSK